jgi:hypothetical protein
MGGGLQNFVIQVGKIYFIKNILKFTYDPLKAYPYEHK